MKFRRCTHTDDQRRSAWQQLGQWWAGSRKIVAEQCSRCGRERRFRVGQDEAQLSGRKAPARVR